MTKARAAAIIALTLAVCAAFVLILRGAGSENYKLVAELDNAAQLTPGNEVRIGAVKIGKVTDVGLTERGTAKVEMEIDDEQAPLGEGTDATIRATSVIGLANRYLVLTPPPGDPPELESGDTIGLANTASPVEFDAVIDTLDANTRSGLQSLIAGGASAYAGRSEDTSRAIRLTAPALISTTGVMRELARDQESFESMIKYGSRVAGTVNSRRDELSALISAANATTTAVANEAESLEEAIGRFPQTMRRGNTLFVKYRQALDDIDPFVAAAKPSTRELAPFLRELRPFLDRARTTVPLTADVVNTPGKANDFTNLLGRLPKLASTSEVAYPNTIAMMDRSEEFLGQLRAYTPDLFAVISNLGQVASYYDANGHYARTIPVMGAQTYDSGLNQLAPGDPSDRLNGFELGAIERCPGGAIQPPPDASAPITFPGCDPSLTPPGP